ncbi:MAG: leucyl aminopeptidase [Corynebacteriales bacterium]|nr:leucyl aminopeptidase [Mycobacteriales bacterium]
MERPVPQLSAAHTPVDQLNADAIVVGIHSGPKGSDQVLLGPGAGPIDTALNGQLTKTLRALGATGSVGEVTKLATLGATTAPIVAAVGLGPAEEKPLAETMRRAAGSALRALAGADKVGIALASEEESWIRPVLEGAALGCYDFTEFKSDLPATYRAPVGEIILLASGDNANELNRVDILTQAVAHTRNWINTPANHLRPPQFADQARELAHQHGLTVEVLDEAALLEHGYGGILAVGQGSTAAPRLVRIAYQPENPRTSIALVGKGITFDTGGISIKPAQGMQDMKTDMSGAASVIATMLAISDLRPQVAVTAYVPMAENMPSGSAYRPGDVITMYGGRKIEILNTDAEGRIVLGDAITRACEDEPEYLIETSTLTGGQITALGHRVSGVMGTPELCERIKDAGSRTGEAMWPMPLPDDVKSGMESAIADFSQINAGWDRAGHMLQGGVYLGECVAEGVKWAHIDIAGPSNNTASAYGYTPKGGTGVPVRTLVELIEDIAAAG